VDAEGEVEPEPDIRVVEIDPTDLADPVEPVKHRVSMHPKQRRRFLWSAGRIEKGFERANKVGVVLAVVVDQG